MKPVKSIALLICFYGEFPWYFTYFIHTCKYNPTVDFYIITDIRVDKSLFPANIKFINRSMEEVRCLISEKMGMQVALTEPYKLCDYRPAYALVFSEIINGYDFWGYIDIDVVYGNIRDFITDELMDNYDLISIRPDWMPGCFSLFRNSEKMNTLFMQSKDYRKVFSNEMYYNFDETGFAHDKFKSGMHYSAIAAPVESMLHVIKKLEEEGYIKPLFDFFMVEGLSGKIKWQDGILYYKGRYEILLYHLMYLKVIYHPKTRTKEITGSFTISPTRIYHQLQYSEA